MAQNKQTRELFDVFVEELLAERSARPLIIIGTSKIDNLLLEILRAFLKPKLAKGNNQDELLEGDTPLGTFSSRIKICRRLGLIDETLFDAIDRLRQIRNLSAHSISFNHTTAPVKDHITLFKGLMINRPSFKLTKERYFEADTLQSTEEIQCLLLTVCVLLEAIRVKIKPTAGNKNALNISAK